jgi:hypothetical protein
MRFVAHSSAQAQKFCNRDPFNHTSDAIELFRFRLL